MHEQAFLSSHLADENFRVDPNSPDPYGLSSDGADVPTAPDSTSGSARRKSGRLAGASGRLGSLDPEFWEEPDITQIKVRLRAGARWNNWNNWNNWRGVDGSCRFQTCRRNDSSLGIPHNGASAPC